MIRYPTSLAELETLIDDEKPGWRERAKERTDGFRAAGKFEESSSIWSEVKGVYMRLQHTKCAFCESKLESIRFGRVEQDVEHFRPKGSVKAWKRPQALKDIPLTPVPAKSPGYHLLRPSSSTAPLPGPWPAMGTCAIGLGWSSSSSTSTTPSATTSTPTAPWS